MPIPDCIERRVTYVCLHCLVEMIDNLDAMAHDCCSVKSDGCPYCDEKEGDDG